MSPANLHEKIEKIAFPVAIGIICLYFLFSIITIIAYNV